MTQKKRHDSISFKEGMRLIRADLADRLMLFKEMIADYGKFILPILLLILVAGTVIFSLSARDRFAEASHVVDKTISETVKQVLPVKETPFETDANPEVVQLIRDYYEALENGDAETLEIIQSSVTSSESIRLNIMAKYIDHYDNITVYTKQGPYEDSFIVYVTSDVYLKNREEATPGLQAFYVSKNEHDVYYINTNQLTDDEADYISKIVTQGDVIDLKNTVNVNYNTLMLQNEELSDYWANLSVEIDTAVGEQLKLDALLKDNGETALAAAEQTTEEDAGQTTVTSNKTIKVRASQTVYVRKSASITADKIGTANAGTTYVLLEEMINGWSKVKYEKTEGYIKTEYLERLENINDLSVIGSVTATTGLNVRSEPKQNSTKLGVLSRGDTVDLIVVNDGWCKINYKGEIGYVKADYVTIN